MANGAITGIAIRGEQGESGSPGGGDMSRSTYDPNEDGVIAITQGGTGATTQSGARTALGLGTMATQAAGSVAITGGAISGITDLAVADGGTGASSAASARSNLGAAATSHTHAQGDITDLTGDLANKADATHAHAASDITSGTLDAARLPAPTVFAGGTTGTAFNFNCDNGTDQRFYLDDDTELTPIGEFDDGRVYELWFHGGAGQVLTVPAEFIFHDDDAYFGQTALTVASAKMLRILAQYVATDSNGEDLEGDNGPYFDCESSTRDAAPLP